MSESCQPTIYIMVAAPGSGKSTYVDEVLQPSLTGRDVELVRADDIRNRLMHETTHSFQFIIHDKACKEKVEAECRDRMMKAFRADKHVIIDRTNVSRESRANPRSRSQALPEGCSHGGQRGCARHYHE